MELMGGWNYRLVRLEDGWVGLYEVYYDGNDRPHMRTDDPTTLGGENEAEAQADLLYAIAALGKPILEDKDIHGH